MSNCFQLENVHSVLGERTDARNPIQHLDTVALSFDI